MITNTLLVSQFDTTSDIPDEAGQFAGDGDTDLVLLQLSPHAQMAVALGPAS